jgi:hypothetical protein
VNQETMSQEDVRKLMAGEHVPRRPAARPCPDRLEIELPMPPSATRPNASGQHWTKKARAIKRQREDAATASAIALRGITPPRWQAASVQATFYRHQKNCRRADSDNLVGWLKASFDGLQDSGVIANDSGLTHLPPQQLLGKEADGSSRVVLVIERKEL